MSYILDALKKLEKERKRGNVPGISTAEELKIKEKKRLIIWPYLLIAALLLNTGLFVWWIAWEKGKTNVIHKENIDKSLASNKTISGFSEKPEGDSVVGRIEDKKTELPSFRKEKKSLDFRNEPSFNRSNLEESTALAKTKAEKLIDTSTNIDGKEFRNNINSSNGDFISPPIKDKIYNLEELPLQIKQKLPPLKIAISLYSDDPSSRMAQINNIMLREGQYLTEGLKLEEITPKDVILNYKNYRFRISLH